MNPPTSRTTAKPTTGDNKGERSIEGMRVAVRRMINEAILAGRLVWKNGRLYEVADLPPGNRTLSRTGDIPGEPRKEPR